MSKFKDIKEPFKIHLPNITIDKSFLKDIRGFRLNWAQKSPDYIEFLGGKTLGVQPIRFSKLDEEKLIEDILKANLTNLKKDLHAVKGINPSWAISSNPIYLTLLYLVHLAMVSKVNNKLRDEVILELMLIFHYKVIGSLVSHYFKYNTNEDIADTTVEKLSNRFLIKKLNNWQEVFIHRSQDAIPEKGLHVRRFRSFTTDDAIYIANDMQGRIRNIVKNIYLVMIDVINNNETIKTTTNLQENEEGVSLKDNVDGPYKYIMYMKSIYNEPEALINSDLLYLVSSYFNNIDDKYLKVTLEYISKHDKLSKSNDNVDIIINESLQYIYNKGITNDYISKISEIIKYLKGYWGVDLKKKKDMDKVKKKYIAFTKKAVSKKTAWLLSGVSVMAIVYIFLRAIVRDKDS